MSGHAFYLGLLIGAALYWLLGPPPVPGAATRTAFGVLLSLLVGIALAGGSEALWRALLG